MDKWVTVGGGVGVMEHILVSVQVTKVIVGWARLQVTLCVLSVCCTTLQCCVLHYCGVQNNTQEFSYIMCELWRRKCHGISLTSDCPLRWPVLNVLLALQLGKRVTSLLPLPFLLLPCIIHSPPMSHPPIHWALANTLQPCTNFQSIKWSQLKPNRRKGQGNSQIWLTVGHSRCTGADLTLTKWKQQKPPFQCIDEKGNQLYQIFILQQEFSFQYSWVLHISTTVAVADLS